MTYIWLQSRPRKVHLTIVFSLLVSNFLKNINYLKITFIFLNTGHSTDFLLFLYSEDNKFPTKPFSKVS